MKYCSKCGSELLDEAVICPKCGCPVDTEHIYSAQALSSKQNDKIKSASNFNFAAFVLSCLMIGVCFFLVIASFIGAPKASKEAADFDVNVEMDFGTGQVTDVEVVEGISPYEETIKIRYVALIGGIVWTFFSISTYILGRQLKKKALLHSKKNIVLQTRIYIFLAIVYPVIIGIIFNVLAPDSMGDLYWEFILIIFIPTVLQIMAGSKISHCIPVNISRS